MGAGTGGYVTITLRTRLSTYDPAADELHRVSELSFTGAPIPDDPAHEELKNLDQIPHGPPPGTPPAGKLGLGGVRPHDVKSFRLFARMNDGTLTDMGVATNPAIRKELKEAFAGEWAGFAVALAPTGGRFSLVADITLKPCWKKRSQQGFGRPFQVIPIVMAFGTDRFVDHYLLSVIAAQQTQEKVDTSITQPYQ